MSFGVQNLGVIDQRGTPAIWQSAYADFPNNFIQGRILISTDNGYGVYLDTDTIRIAIVDTYLGNITADNGLTYNNSIPNNKDISLGGVLLYDTAVNTMGNELSFVGANMSIESTKIQTIVAADQPTVVQNAVGDITFLTDGGLYRNGGTIDGEILSTTDIGVSVVVPNTTLLFKRANGENFKILAEAI